MEKVVTFGGPIYECLTLYDKGDTKPFEVIIEQLSDAESDYRQINKLILEVDYFFVIVFSNKFSDKKVRTTYSKATCENVALSVGDELGRFSGFHVDQLVNHGSGCGNL